VFILPREEKEGGRRRERRAKNEGIAWVFGKKSREGRKSGPQDSKKNWWTRKRPRYFIRRNSERRTQQERFSKTCVLEGGRGKVSGEKNFWGDFICDTGVTPTALLQMMLDEGGQATHKKFARVSWGLVTSERWT